MQCKICGHDNPAEARFCANCGAVLVAVVEPPPPAAAPEVELKYAGFWIRFCAAILDGILVWLICFALYWLPWQIRAYAFGFLPVPFYFVVLWLYFWLFTGLMGLTPGKMAARIKVVDTQSNRVSLRGAALREILGKTVSTIVLFLGFRSIIRDEEKQGWHDKIAGTYVVKVTKAKSMEK